MKNKTCLKMSYKFREIKYYCLEIIVCSLKERKKIEICYLRTLLSTLNLMKNGK